ncbi:MAG: aspartate aminotransferase family protein [Phycisphaerae bacterium]|nr:aspartate aminotransferase family protein [Phycisphaerae bacterium]
MSKSEDLVQRRDRVVCRGVSRLSGLTVASASGATLIDADGKKYIDFAGGIGVMNAGHCAPRVVDAIVRQAGQLLHTCIHVATYEPYVALCEKLVKLLPHGPETKALLVNTGAEAVDNAIKIARQATGRAGVICFTGAFHGRTIMGATLTSKIGYKVGCGPFVPEVYRVPYPRREAGSSESEAQLVQRELTRMRDTLREVVAPGAVAAVIIELVQGEGGFYVAPKAYIEGLRAICDEHGILLIFDEIQSGFGRTGSWGAYQRYGVVPDLSTWAKSMGGGLPISCVLGRAAVMDRATPGTLGGTYGGNPVACAAALAAIETMEALDLNARAEAIGRTIRRRMEKAAIANRCLTDVRGLGAMLALELHDDGDPAQPATACVKAVIEACLSRGLLLLPAGVSGNVIRILCPLVIADDQLDLGLQILEEELSARAAPASKAASGAVGAER